MADFLIEAGIKSVLIFALGMGGFAYATWIERKFLARLQMRYGPNRAGKFGLLQPIADGLKLFFKEELTPAGADKVIFTIAPIVTLLPALLVFAGQSSGMAAVLLTGSGLSLVNPSIALTTAGLVLTTIGLLHPTVAMEPPFVRTVPTRMGVARLAVVGCRQGFLALLREEERERI